MAFDRSRFYTIDGHEYPSVTTILGAVVDKSGPLTHWAANQERRAFEAAMLEAVVTPEFMDVVRTRGADEIGMAVLECVQKSVRGAKAMLKEQDKAASIGTAAHAAIEWRIRKLLGEDPGEEPTIPDAAQWAVEAWDTWRKEVAFTPIATERVVYCPTCGYAGTVDWIGRVRDVMTLGDTKTAKGIYPEMLLQVTAYRHAAKQQGLDVAQSMILRLPKVQTDPEFEVMVAPELPLRSWQAALTLWRTLRWLDGKPIGVRRAVLCAA